MLPDFELIQHQFYGGQDISIAPVFDVHLGSPNCMDALITGHTHKPYTTQPGKIKVDPFNNKVSLQPFKVISATSWLEFGGYAAQKMLLPSSHCLQTLTLRGNKKEIIVTM